jgi:hypothetical protein
VTSTPGYGPWVQLDVATAVPYLVGRGLITAGTAQLLEGGVSATVVAVDTPGGRVVVKQALPQLRVAQTWLADPRRSGVEAAALQLLHGLTPGQVPSLIDHDPDNHIVVLEAAPAGWRTWKAELLDGGGDGVAGGLGTILAHWHRATAGLDEPRFTDLTGFTEQRIDPYFRTVQGVHPSIAPAVDRVLDVMLGRPDCLVHGDFSPKNVLVGDGRLWVLDFEIAHVGDSAFDLAFLLSHLLLKQIHLGRPDEHHLPFLDAYRSAGGMPIDERHLLGLLGCLLLARVDGKSPAEYLNEPQRDQTRQRALAILGGDITTLEQAWRQT